MKTKLLHFTIICCIFGLCIIIIGGCQKSSNTSTTPSCSVAGTTVNTGTATGGTYWTSVGGVAGHGDFILFNNTNLNFTGTSQFPDGSGAGGLHILDVGPQSCLDFSYSGTPTAATVAYKTGEGYVGLFDDGHVVKFIAKSYSGGIALINYTFQ